jgi:hypothetical protein
MENYLLIILSVLYAGAAWSLLMNRKMPRHIIWMLVIPLMLEAAFYFFALFLEMPHWAVATGQSLYLIAIIIIEFFARRDEKRQ